MTIDCSGACTKPNLLKLICGVSALASLVFFALDTFILGKVSSESLKDGVANGVVSGSLRGVVDFGILKICSVPAQVNFVFVRASFLLFLHTNKIGSCHQQRR